MMKVIRDEKLRNFARLRKTYQEISIDDTNMVQILLLNTMWEIEELLTENGIDYREFDGSEFLED